MHAPTWENCFFPANDFTTLPLVMATTSALFDALTGWKLCAVAMLAYKNAKAHNERITIWITRHLGIISFFVNCIVKTPNTTPRLEIEIYNPNGWIEEQIKGKTLHRNGLLCPDVQMRDWLYGTIVLLQHYSSNTRNILMILC